MKAIRSAQAKAVLVFGNLAALTDISATVVRPNTRPRLRFTGTVAFSKSLKSHIRRVILPLIDQICIQLGIGICQFELEAANLSIASHIDRSVEIIGYSADLPIFTALLGACLGVSVPVDVVATGHVGSRRGVVKAVSNLEAKMVSAAADATALVLYYPASNSDASLSTMAPEDYERNQVLSRRRFGELKLVAVATLHEYVRDWLADWAILQSSFSLGFYHSQPTEFAYLGAELVKLFTADLENRFYRAVSDLLLNGEGKRARTLVALHGRFYVERHRYPAGHGAKLIRVVGAVPPRTRPLGLETPLISPKLAAELSTLASAKDASDVSELLKVSLGESTGRDIVLADENLLNSEAEDYGVQNLLRRMEPEEVARRVNQPIDEARARFVMDSVSVGSNEEFLQTISAFYQHLFQSLGEIDGGTAADDIRHKAHALVEQSMGFKVAVAEAMQPVNGGLRGILDTMTDAFVRQRRREYLMGLVSEAVDPTDWEFQLNFVKSFLRRFVSVLPESVVNDQPERYVGHYERLVLAYSESFDELRRVLKAL